MLVYHIQKLNFNKYLINYLQKILDYYLILILIFYLKILIILIYLKLVLMIDF